MLRLIELSLALVLGLVCTIGGSLVATRELAAVPPKLSAQSLAALTGTTDPMAIAGVSYSAHQGGLTLCLEALRHTNALSLRFLDKQQKSQLDQRCADLAAALTASSPLNAHAWLVGAMAAAKQGAWQRVDADLSASQAAAPTQNWLATIRLELGLSHLDQRGPTAIEALEMDVGMLAGTEPGARLLAEHYVSLPAARDFIESRLETEPPLIQRRFVNTVARSGRYP